MLKFPCTQGSYVLEPIRKTAADSKLFSSIFSASSFLTKSFVQSSRKRQKDYRDEGNGGDEENTETNAKSLSRIRMNQGSEGRAGSISDTKRAVATDKKVQCTETET